MRSAVIACQACRHSITPIASCNVTHPMPAWWRPSSRKEDMETPWGRARRRGVRGRERKAQAVRVATAGGTEAALRAGPYTAAWPSSHSSTAPIGK